MAEQSEVRPSQWSIPLWSVTTTVFSPVAQHLQVFDVSHRRGQEPVFRPEQTLPGRRLVIAVNCKNFLFRIGCRQWLHWRDMSDDRPLFYVWLGGRRRLALIHAVMPARLSDCPENESASRAIAVVETGLGLARYGRPRRPALRVIRGRTQ